MAYQYLSAGALHAIRDKNHLCDSSLYSITLHYDGTLFVYGAVGVTVCLLRGGWLWMGTTFV